MSDQIVRHRAAANVFPPDLAAELLPTATMLRAKAGRTLVALGAEVASVFLVLEGRVQVTLFSTSGQEIVLRDLGPSALFGELAAIDDQPRSASIVALDDCVLASFTSDRFRRAACATPAAALWLAQRLTAQIRELSDKVFELNALRVPGRLHCELLRLCHNVQGDIGGRITPFPTHAELASRIGSTREAVTREIGYLTQKGVLAADGRRAMVVDLSQLSDLVRDATGDIGTLRRGWPAGNGAAAEARGGG